MVVQLELVPLHPIKELAVLLLVLVVALVEMEVLQMRLAATVGAEAEVALVVMAAQEEIQIAIHLLPQAQEPAVVEVAEVAVHVIHFTELVLEAVV
jgi:hypothetical protein